MNAILLFDLDGTFIRGNSFHHWLRHLLRTGGGAPKSVLLRGRILHAAFLRAARLIGHAEMKRRVLSAWVRCGGGGPAAGMLEILFADINPAVGAALSFAGKAGIPSVLVTAAPAVYAAPFAANAGFDHVIATPLPGAGWKENLRSVKRDNVLALLQELGWESRPRILFTDHADDLPLMRECGRVIWCGAERDLDAIRVSAATSVNLLGDFETQSLSEPASA